jgi:hypothetical protein
MRMDARFASPGFRLWCVEVRREGHDRRGVLAMVVRCTLVIRVMLFIDSHERDTWIDVSGHD